MLEVIANSIDDIKLINKSQADQIEFCLNPLLGGVAPDLKLVDQAMNIATKKLRVLVRFDTTSFELDKKKLSRIRKYVVALQKFPLDGIVFGALDHQNYVDFKTLSIIIKANKNRNLTFHKAIDLCQNKAQAVQQLATYPEVKYILTSGGIGAPEQNRDFFRHVASREQILVGGSVTLKTIKVLKKLNYHNFHIGKLARKGMSYDGAISIRKINRIAKLIAQK